MNPTRKELIQRLTNFIARGEFVKDGKLPSERELASLMGTSRPLLREALISLEALGYLDIRDRQGIFLAGETQFLKAVDQAHIWPMDILAQVMEIRQIMDPGATALAALRRNDGDMEKLNECLAMLEKIHSAGGPDAADQGAYWNTVLHSTIFKATGNTLLARLYESLLEMSERGISVMRSDALDSRAADRTTQALEQHRRLVAAIRNRDMKRAREASKEHLRASIKSMVELSQVTPLSDFFSQRIETLVSN
ncbi:MAG: FCD domain-containing protein [Acidobacteriota bacterium]|jgi:GntR family transcriptional repressor for pyruvate dehydrogenase complex|nr:FCD domain-containing protein [Acidobacteriota bacterium]